jgi:DNA primase catalytic core
MIANAEKIKTSVLMTEVLEHFNINVQYGKCACPIHQGKDKNFVVKKEFATCFSQCGGKTWDAVGFVMDYCNMDYREALEELAKIGKVSIEYQTGNYDHFVKVTKEEKEHKQVLWELNKSVANAYFANFLSISKAQGFDEKDGFCIDKRAYKFDTIKAFGVSYTLGSFLIKEFVSRRWEYKHLEELGLIHKRDGSPYDYFYNRFLFPVQDDKGNIVGFGARKSNSDKSESPKYLNSKDSLVYKKSEILYGLHQNKLTIKKADNALLVEGYTDVMTMFDFDIKQAVASCGTAFTLDHAKLLKRYTDNVTMLFDGDAAGIKAAKKAIEPLLMAGHKVKVCLLPIDLDATNAEIEKAKKADAFSKEAEESGTYNKFHDPDSFLRKHGKKAFDLHVEELSQDAIIWRIGLEFDEKKTSASEQVKAFDIATKLLGMIDEDYHEFYYKELSQKDMLGTGAGKRIMKGLRKVEQIRQEKAKQKDWTPEQLKDIQLYGLVIEDKKYKVAYGANDCYEICNFYMNPIMLVKSADVAWRILEVINEFNIKHTIKINTDDMVELGNFKKILARLGNYVYTGKPENFVKIQRKIYNETPECYNVRKLGWQKTGFYAWGNGITTIKGEFKPVDEYGVVAHGENKFFLPAFSKINTQDMFDEETMYDEEKQFVFTPGLIADNQGKEITWCDYTKKFVEVHGNNGIIGLCFYLAALHRSVVYKRLDFFPILNLFGPKGAGKSFMAKSIMYFFGDAQQGFNLMQGTQVAFYRKLSKINDGCVWFDEYQNNVEIKRVEALKDSYDGGGHQKGSKENEDMVKKVAVKSAIVMSGQEQPTQDIALFTRCISLNFPKEDENDARDARGRDLRKIEKRLQLTQFTARMLQHRDLIDSEFSDTFEKLRQELTPRLKDLNLETLIDRTINNYLVPLTVFKIISQKEEFGFTYEELLAICIENIATQTRAMGQEDEVSTWWKLISFFASTGLINHGEDLIVQKVDKLTLMKHDKTTETKIFEGNKTVLFLRFDKSFALYREHHSRQYKKNGMPESSIKYYLDQHHAKIGIVKGKKFSNGTFLCWAFDLDKLNIELPLTIEVKGVDGELKISIEEENKPPLQSAGWDKVDSLITDTDLPF